MSLLPDGEKPKSLLGYHRQLAPTAAVKVSPICLGAMNLGTAWCAISVTIGFRYLMPQEKEWSTNSQTTAGSPSWAPSTRRRASNSSTSSATKAGTSSTPQTITKMNSPRPGSASGWLSASAATRWSLRLNTPRAGVCTAKTAASSPILAETMRKV